MPSFDAGQTGLTPGVTVLDTDGTVHTARTTAGLSKIFDAVSVQSSPITSRQVANNGRIWPRPVP